MSGWESVWCSKDPGGRFESSAPIRVLKKLCDFLSKLVQVWGFKERS